jgi:GNAT superfamily N-acetyltransferase
MIEVKQLQSADEMAALFDLRARVLRPGAPPEESHFVGDDDAGTVHLGAFVEDESGRGRCVGIASLFRDNGVRLRGMAVDFAWQRRGVGIALIRHAQRLIEQAKGDEQSDGAMWCNARLIAVPFYEKLGWKIEGDEFDIPDIGPHYVMRWQAG